MTLKATGLVVATVTLAAVAIGSLRGVSQQIWNPQLARTATVTANLFKDSAIDPIRLARQTRSFNQQERSASLRSHPELLSYTINHHALNRYSSLERVQRQFSRSVKPSNPLGLTPSQSFLQQPGKTRMMLKTTTIFSRFDTKNLEAPNWAGSMDQKTPQRPYQLEKPTIEL
jgi:hypothetical protein